MARKFALYLKDGHEVRNNIEEIREYFDYGKMVECFHDGSLQQWLDDRHYEAESIALSALDANISDFKKKLCYIFHVDENTIEDEKNIVDEFTIKKLEIVRQYTTDKHILDNIAKVATNQDELNELVESNEKEIYLCANSFIIPLDIANIKYLGIGNPIAVIKSDKMINFEKNKIFFRDISFDDEYEKIYEYETGEGLWKKIKDPRTIAELLSVIINGKLKNGEFLWKTGGNEDVKSHNFMYDLWTDKAVAYYFPHYKGADEYVIGGAWKGNLSTCLSVDISMELWPLKMPIVGTYYGAADEYLIFTNAGLWVREKNGKWFNLFYDMIKNVLITEKHNLDLVYETKDGLKRKLAYDRSYIWNNKIGLDGIRLYLLVVAKIFGDCKYVFNDNEKECLSKVRLESLYGKYILDFL